MKKVSLVLILATITVIAYAAYTNLNRNTTPSKNIATAKPSTTDTKMTDDPNTYCEENNGILVTVTDENGNEIVFCDLGSYTCQVDAFINGECDVEGDAKLIEEALIAKELDLKDMKVEIKKHLGSEIEGAVVPVSAPAGGGYVFAKKTAEGMKIVADGNGIISCEAMEAYPDFSTYLIPECYNELTGNLEAR